MPSRTFKIKKHLFTLVGFLYAWMVLGNMVGWSVASIYKEEHSAYYEEYNKRPETCRPYFMWGGYEVHCKSEVADWIWTITVGIPGLLTSILATCFGLLYKNAMSQNDDWFMEGVLWIPWTLPIILLIIIPGCCYWRKKSKILFYFLLIVFAYILQWWTVRI
jgi:hypothetical protein